MRGLKRNCLQFRPSVDRQEGHPFDQISHRGLQLHQDNRPHEGSQRPAEAKG
jgi:hypothetical protein